MKNKVPKLRFPEFSGDWEEKRFGEIYSFRSTNSLSRDKLNYEQGKVKNIHYGDIHTKFKTLFDITNEKTPFINDEVSLEKIPEDNYCKNRDLIIADASEDYSDIGKSIEIINTNNQKILAGLHTFLARPDLYELALGFGGYIMKSPTMHLQIKTIAQGTKVLSLSSKRVAELKFFIPCLPEQEKIASFLSKVDESIEILEEEKELWEKYKKGMMQKIFSQKLRFKDENGSDYPEWKEKRLGEVCNIIMGQSPSSLAYNENFEGLPLVQGNADCKKRKIIPRIYSSEITKESLPKDIIMSVRAPAGTIAKSDIHSCIGRGVCAIRSKIENQEYIYQYLINYEDEWSKYSQGSTFDSINSNDIKGLCIPLPSLPEQEKIANFLSSIDEKIELIEKELQGVKEFKKGLLQQMFV